MVVAAIVVVVVSTVVVVAVDDAVGAGVVVYVPKRMGVCGTPLPGNKIIPPKNYESRR